MTHTGKVEELVEQLQRPMQWCCIFEHEGQVRHGTTNAPFQAATALAELQADNEKLREALERCQARNRANLMAKLKRGTKVRAFLEQSPLVEKKDG